MKAISSTRGDVIFIGADEAREITINDGKPAEVLVTIINP